MNRRKPLDPTFDEKRQRWKIDIPATRSETGKRMRVFFPNRKAAREYAATLIANPQPVIEPRVAEDAGTARQRLDAAGLDLTLTEAVRELIEARAAVGNTPLIDAAREAAERAAERSASKPVREAVAAFLDVKAETLRPTTLSSYAYSLERVLEPLHGRTLADISAADLETALAEKAPTSRSMHYRNVRAFIKWSARQPRCWCQPDIMDAVEVAKASDDADIEILNADDIRALLDAARQVSPSAASAFAVAVFGGVRMGELSKLAWKDVGDEHIEIGRHVAKRHARRLVPICPALRAWLDACRPTDAEPDDLIVGSNWREVSRAARRLAGWDVVARLLDNPPKPTRGAWPANAPRHTCASVQTAIGTPLDSLVFSFGHAGGHDLLRRHYVSRLSRKEAVAILSIGPAGQTVPSVAVA